MAWTSAMRALRGSSLSVGLARGRAPLLRRGVTLRLVPHQRPQKLDLLLGEGGAWPAPTPVVA